MVGGHEWLTELQAFPPCISAGGAAELIRGAWLVFVRGVKPQPQVVAKLAGFLLAPSDQSPQRRVVDRNVPRQCAFVLVRDADDLPETGAGHLFWSIRVQSVDVPEIVKDREQILAEAVELVRGPESDWALPVDMERLARKAQAHFREEDEGYRDRIAGLIERWWTNKPRRFVREGEEWVVYFTLDEMILGAQLGDFESTLKAVQGKLARILRKQCFARKLEAYQMVPRGQRGWKISLGK